MRWEVFKKKNFLLGVCLLVLIAAYNFTALGRLGGRAQEAFFYIGSPLWHSGRSLGSAWYGLTNGLELQQRLAEKELSEAALAAENVKLNFLKDENRELRQLLGFKTSAAETIIPASVLAYSTVGGRSALIINQGSENGLKERLPVVAPNGVLVGKVAGLTPNMATVLLTVDNESSIAASLSEEPAVQAIAKGKMGLSLLLELIPQDTEIAVGDIVVTSPLEENTPPGLVIGRVAAVFYKEGELFKRANLEPVVSPMNIRTVGIILPSF